MGVNLLGISEVVVSIGLCVIGICILMEKLK